MPYLAMGYLMGALLTAALWLGVSRAPTDAPLARAILTLVGLLAALFWPLLAFSALLALSTHGLSLVWAWGRYQHAVSRHRSHHHD